MRAAAYRRGARTTRRGPCSPAALWGCAGARDDCLLNASASTITSLAQYLPKGDSFETDAWAPVVDGVALTRPLTESLAAGLAAGVVAAIVVVPLVTVLIVMIVVVLCCCRRRAKQTAKVAAGYPEQQQATATY